MYSSFDLDISYSTTEPQVDGTHGTQEEEAGLHSQLAQLQHSRTQQSEQLSTTQQECARLQHLLEAQAQVQQSASPPFEQATTRLSTWGKVLSRPVPPPSHNKGDGGQLALHHCRLKLGGC